MKYLVLALALISPIAFAGNERGNGGDAVVCYNQDGSIKSVEFFDLYEAKERFKFTLVPSQAETLEEKVDELIGRIAPLNPSRAEKYRAWAKTFFSEADFLTDKELIDIPDTGWAYFPKGCAIKQAVIQHEPVFAMDKRYTINKEYWDAMSLDNQAALVVHELVFRETSSEFGHKTSQSARYFHALVEANQLADMNVTNYIKTLRTLEFQNADFGGFKIELRSADFHENGVPSRARILNPTHFSMGKVKIGIDRNENISVSALAFFYPSGNLRSLDAGPGYPLLSVDFEQENQSIHAEAVDSVSFRENGTIQFLSENGTLGKMEVKSPLYWIHIENGGYAYTMLLFSEDGSIALPSVRISSLDAKCSSFSRVLINQQWIDFSEIRSYKNETKDIPLKGKTQILVRFDQDFTLGRNVIHVISGEYGFDRAGSIVLDENGNVESVSSVPIYYGKQTVRIGDQDVEVYGTMYFYPNGEIRQAHLKKRQTLKLADGTEELICAKGSRKDELQFNEKGEVTNATGKECSLFDLLIGD